MNATTPEGATAMDREYAGHTVTLRSARRDVVDWLAECEADGDTIERASLIVSELASNAIQAAPGVPYQLRLVTANPDAVELSIRNRTGGGVPPPRGKWRPVDELAIRGRGLSIVDALSDELTVEVVGDEVIVTALFPVITSS